MAFQSAPNTVEVNPRFVGDGVPMENAMTFSRAGGYDLADITALADAVQAWVISDYLPLVNNLVTSTGTYVKGLEFAEDVQYTALTGAGTAGAVGSAMANNVTKAITLRSGLTGRSSRGRLFAVGLSATQLNGVASIEQSYVDDIIAALEALKVIIEALGWIWVIVSRYHNNAKRAVAVNFNVNAFGTSDLTTDSMRGRLSV